MNSLTRSLVLAAAVLSTVIAAALPASAGTASASFQASLTIVGSCTVNAQTTRPQVACNYADAFRVDLAPQQSPQSQQQIGRDGVWTVTF